MMADLWIYAMVAAAVLALVWWTYWDSRRQARAAASDARPDEDVEFLIQDETERDREAEAIHERAHAAVCASNAQKPIVTATSDWEDLPPPVPPGCESMQDGFTPIVQEDGRAFILPGIHSPETVSAYRDALAKKKPRKPPKKRQRNRTAARQRRHAAKSRTVK